MKEAIVHTGPRVEIVTSDTPKPSASQVLIKVSVSGSNPKDWKYPEWTGKSLNQGDDIAGTIEEVGSEVYEFKRGDRVAAFHTMLAPGGSYAEFALAEAWTTSHIPPALSFEEAATLPLAYLTAAIGLHVDLGLPSPWTPATKEIPLIIYGGASAVGAFAIKLAVIANIHPLIVVAGRGIPFVEGLIDKSKGDRVIDYREGDDSVVNGLRDAAAGRTILHAFDPTSEKGSYNNIGKVLGEGAKLSLVLPGKDYQGIPDYVTHFVTSVGTSHKQNSEFAFVAFRWLFKKIRDGDYKPHPHEVVPGGLRGVEQALANLKDGKASAVKYVFRIAET